jgi:hypothetical protein
MTKEEAVSKENKITVLESLIVISEFCTWNFKVCSYF